MFTSRLTLSEIISIVVAAPPGSATHHGMNEGWTITDHLLATTAEQDAGLIRLTDRFVRPGVKKTSSRSSTPTRIDDKSNPRVSFDVMSLDDYRARRDA